MNEPINGQRDKALGLPDLEEIKHHLEGIMSVLIRYLRIDAPEIGTAAVASEALHLCADAMEPLIPTQAIAQGALIVFEGLHEKPMNFIQIGQAKQALENISATRKKLEAGLIIPGDFVTLNDKGEVEE